MTLHLYDIGTRIVEELEILIHKLGDESDNATTSRDSQKPYIRFRKRKSGSGREASRMRIGEGITVVPMANKFMGGTNEREDVGYTYLVALVDGTVTDEVEAGWRVATWEQGIRQRFQGRRLGGFLGVEFCELACILVPGSLPDWASVAEGMDQTFIRFTCVVRESRRS